MSLECYDSHCAIEVGEEGGPSDNNGGSQDPRCLSILSREVSGQV